MWAPCEEGVVGVAVGLAPKGRCLPASGCQEQSGSMDMSKWCLLD